MNVTVYLYHSLATVKPKLFHCLSCNRVMFSFSADNVIIANIMGGRNVFEPGQAWIDIRCHSCKTPHKILFQ